MDNYQINLAKQIKSLRKKAGLTQDQLSDKAKISYSTLAKIEHGGIKNPSVFTIYAIANALDTTIDELFAKPTQVLATGDIKFLFVDMNGVLVRFFQRGFVKISEENHISVDKIESTFWHYNDAANRGDMSLAEFNKAMCDHLGLKDLDWKRYYSTSVEPIKEMHKLLHDVSKEIPIGILSNTMPGFIDELRDKGLIPDLDYACIVDSSVVGSVKPEPTIYKTAESLAGFSGENILFVDDSRTNLMAAEKFGWRVLWFDDYRPSESVKRVKDALLNADYLT